MDGILFKYCPPTKKRWLGLFHIKCDLYSKIYIMFWNRMVASSLILTKELHVVNIPFRDRAEMGVVLQPPHWYWLGCSLVSRYLTFNLPCHKRLKRTKDLFAKSVLLESPDSGKPFYIQTDASRKGFGAILFQLEDDGQKRIIATASRGANRREAVMSATESEICAIAFAWKKFWSYIFNQSVTIESDHVSWLLWTGASLLVF